MSSLTSFGTWLRDLEGDRPVVREVLEAPGRPEGVRKPLPSVLAARETRMSNVVAFPKQVQVERWISKRRLAEIWGCSTRQIERLVAEGMPSREPRRSASNRRMFLLSECDEWREQR